MIITEETYLAHYGILRKSGRYPWGSGGTQSERNRTFLSTIDDLKKQGMSDVQIARSFSSPDQPFTTTMLRAAKSIAKNEEKQANIGQAERLRAKGYSNVAIGERMGIPESSVRALLAPGQKARADVLESTANMLKAQVAEKGYIQIGTGVEHQVGVSSNKLSIAVARLKEEGYTVHSVQVDQLGTNNKTTVKVLAPPGTTYRDVAANKDKIRLITEHSDDGGRTFLGIHPPLSVSSKRVGIRYAEDGGADADGVIYVRPGVKDISLGKSNYAQVRVAVDGSHYLKGMAIYKDDLPDGVDLQFNTNKSNTGNKLDALKSLKDDPDNPFGATVRQLTERGKDGKEKVTSAMNIVNDEADWDKWSKNLSSQFLSKQSPSLAKQQLAMTAERKQREFETIMALTNPAVKRKLLEDFADGADSSSVHLKAAALPNQKTHVILPMNSMKETEVYAPNYKNGEHVVLVRFPHGGTFEIPELVVNNRNPQAKKLMGNAPNAIGINAKVAQRLSGADFDGDTVLVIPNDRGQVKTSPPLKGLENFDPIRSYPKYDGMHVMTASQKGQLMGDISNLITDMTIKGASADEKARAIKHSMVIIDAEKHELNYKQSALDNGIVQLKKKYQGSATAGAKTLISAARSRTEVLARTPRAASEGGSVDKATGKKVYTQTGESYVDARGRTIMRTQRSTKLAETDDAHTLSSGTVIEKIYADHSNRMKDLANKARKEAVNTPNTKWSQSAKKAYATEVASLDAKLRIALRNAPLERQAQLVANATVARKRASNAEMDAAELKKIKGQALAAARISTGAHKQRIEITDSEWDAIQAGAISANKLDQILANADIDVVKKLATPRSAMAMTNTQKTRALSMLASGYTQADVAEQLGVSVSTLTTSISG